MYRPAKSSKKKNQMMKVNQRLVLLSSAAVLFVGFIILLIFALNTRPASVEVPEDYVFAKGISIAGTDISGMDKAKASAALKKKETEMLNAIEITVDVKDSEFKYKASDLGIESNLDIAMAEAMLYEKMGGAYKDEYKIMVKKEKGVDFKLLPILDVKKTKARLTADTEKLNIPPTDAKVVFDPKKSTDPITFEKEKSGAVVDIAALKDLIAKAVDKQDYTTINAPIKEVAPKYTLDVIQKNTKMVSTFTSSFAGDGLHSKNRVANIVKMTEIINGQVIEPGQVWSINDTAGDRTEEKGWALAPGIENGVYTDQPGGGVCQVSSTLYNAALRAELEIVERKPHSWPSTYIKPGLDATISTGSPDLKIRNQNIMPVYIVAYVDKEKMACTVDIYGEPLEHGFKVEMVSKVISYELPPIPEIKETDKDANGDPLQPGKSIKVRDPKPEIHVKVYKQYIDPVTNKVIRTMYMYETVYSAKAKLYYENPANPVAQATKGT